MYTERAQFYQQLEDARGSKVPAYVTGDRPGLETQISTEVVDYFVDHLDALGYPPPMRVFNHA